MKEGLVKGLILGGMVGGVTGGLFVYMLSIVLYNTADIRMSAVFYGFCIGALCLGIFVGIVTTLLGLIIDLFINLKNKRNSKNL